MYNLNNMDFTNVRQNVSYSIDVQECFTTTALNMMQYINESNNENLCIMSRSIVEGKPINEAVNIYCKSNIFLIDKTLESIGKMINLFDKELFKFFADRKIFIDRVKEASEQIEQLGKSALTIEGFFYTEMKQPNIILASEFKSGYSDLLSKLPKDVYDKISRKYRSGEYLSSIRQYTLHGNSQIPEKSFRDEVFKFYRNNTNKESVCVYKEAQVADAIRKILDYKVYIDNLNELYSDIISQSNEVKRCISLLCDGLCDMSTINNVVYGEHSKYVKDTVPENFNETIDAINKIKISTIPGFMGIYMMVVSDKIESMKSSIKQNIVLLDSFCNMITLGEDE